MLRNKLWPHDRSIQLNSKHKPPAVSVYDRSIVSLNGEKIDLSGFKGKKLLLVNTASNCGFTAQYGELETLYRQNRDKLVVIGFPANDFKQQEPLDNAHIAEFCAINFGVSFPLAQKTQVIKGAGQDPVFSWLTHADQNGWCNQQPLWNFCKYLIDENGELVGFFAHTVSPLHPKITALISGNAPH
ncbi:MAG: glutathione peroxidase [Chitinophagaceae bacterium]|nr:glutathione peroxidase [Chitinophagaceae bacterium]